MTIYAVFAACSSGPTEEEIAVKVDDFRQRSAQYFNARNYLQAYQQAKLAYQNYPDKVNLKLNPAFVIAPGYEVDIKGFVITLS